MPASVDAVTNYDVEADTQSPLKSIPGNLDYTSGAVIRSLDDNEEIN